MRIRSLLSALAVALAGCTTPSIACTLIGCEDGLAVRFNRQPAGAFRVEAIVPSHPTPYTIDCADVATCYLFFTDLMEERVTLRVTTADGTFTQDFTPLYEDRYPNGRRCGAACRQAVVTFRL